MNLLPICILSRTRRRKSILLKGLLKEDDYNSYCLKKDFIFSSRSFSYAPSFMLFVLSNSSCNLLDEAANKTYTHNNTPKCHISNVLSSNLLYQWFDHPSKHVLKCILSSLSLPCLILVPNFCDTCQYGKIHQFLFYSTGIKIRAPLKLIHTDLWGPTPNISLQGYRYYISFYRWL